MKGLEVYVSTDYSTGPGPRVVMEIDCENIPDNYWDVAMQKELIKDTKSAFAKIAKFNSNDLSIILLNDAAEKDDRYEDYVRFNIDLSYILRPLYDEYNMKSVWIHTLNDFTDIYPHIEHDLSGYYCKAEKHVVCGKYDPDNSEINVKGEQCEFPVKALYRKSFNQKIWKINGNSARDVTSKIDPFYNIWKNQ